MSAEQNKSIVRRWVEGAWNGGDESLIDEIFSPDYKLNDPTAPMPITDRESFRQFFVMWRSVIPDMQVTIENILAEGDKVAWTFVASGTQQGPMDNIPATGKPVSVRGSIISRFENGRWAEDWMVFDLFTLFQQIGVIPA